MKKKFRKIWLAVAGTAALTLAGCGGGGGSSSAPTSPAASSFSGTAATGAALANAGVAITNSSGNSPCQEASITTTALGSYTCTLKTGETAPFFVVVTDPTSNTAPLVSVATTTPAAGTPLTVNVTPLTTALVAQLSADGNALTLVNSKTVDTAALKQLTANVVAQLANVLAAIGAPAGYDPFTTSITAATASGTGNTADMVLDVVKVVTMTDPATGKLALALTTVDNPTPIALATATTAGSTVATPATGVSTLSQATQIAAQAFTSCFALPTTQRVLTKDTPILAAQGGPEVTSVAAACQDMVASLSSAAGVNFLHNGYKGGQLLYGILTSDTMTGAKFSMPEIMAFYPAANTASGKDEAVLNIKYIDANGNPGNVVTVARNIPNTTSTSRPTNWWLVGNQHPVDVVVRLNIRRVEQLNPANTNQNRISTFQTGIQFRINTKGPGSSNTNGALKFARISGPGLPGNGAAGTGLVYVTSTGPLNYMDIFNKTGSLTLGTQCGGGGNFDCPNLWFSRTKGLTGTDATTLAANQLNGNGTGPSAVWAAGDPAIDGIDPTKVVKGATYKVELFYGSNTTTPGYTFHKTLLSDLIPAIQAVNLPWNKLGAQSVSALDPAGSLAGAQSALPVDWVQNIAAQQIGSVTAMIDTLVGGYGPDKAVPKGATSAVLDNMTVPAFNTVTPPRRNLLFGYRMLDTSNKTAVYTYN